MSMVFFWISVCGSLGFYVLVRFLNIDRLIFLSMPGFLGVCMFWS